MKKMISILAASVLLTSAIPTAVFATDTTADTVQTASTEQTAKTYWILTKNFDLNAIENEVVSRCDEYTHTLYKQDLPLHEIEKLSTEYYNSLKLELLEAGSTEISSKILEELGVNKNDAFCSKYTGTIICDLTDEQAKLAETSELIEYIEAYKPEGIKSMTPAESIENVDRNFAKRNTKPLEKITYSTADELVNGILNGKSAEEVFGENVKVSAELNSGVNGSSDFLVVYGLKSKKEISGIMNKFYQELNFDYVTTLCEFRSGIDFRLYSDRLETHAISVFVFVNDENPSYVTETSIADFTGNLGFNPSKYIITFGDTNGDYVIDSTDASDVLSLYAKLSTDKDLKATDEQLKHYDTNADGVIDASDASNILAYYSYVSTGGKCSLKDFLNL